MAEDKDGNDRSDDDNKRVKSSDKDNALLLRHRPLNIVRYTDIFKLVINLLHLKTSRIYMYLQWLTYLMIANPENYRLKPSSTGLVHGF